MTSPCDRAALVEAMLDGRLGPSERASSERHLESCAFCAELARDLTSIQQQLRSSSSPISALEHQRARLALLRQSAKPSAPRRRPAALIVAAVLLLPVAAWAAVRTFAPLISGEKAATEGSPVEAANVKHARRKPASPTALDPNQAGTSAPATPEASPSAPAVPSAAPALSSDSTPHPSAAPVKAAPTNTPSVRRPRPKPREVQSPLSPANEASHASHDFAAAMEALSRGDFSASAGKLASFATAYPRDPRVEDAMYLEAIALERAGRITDAKAAARRYLAVYPQGVHHLPARRITGD